MLWLASSCRRVDEVLQATNSMAWWSVLDFGWDVQQVLPAFTAFLIELPAPTSSDATMTSSLIEQIHP